MLELGDHQVLVLRFLLEPAALLVEHSNQPRLRPPAEQRRLRFGRQFNIVDSVGAATWPLLVQIVCYQPEAARFPRSLSRLLSM
jgi:hypothetical protein